MKCEEAQELITALVDNELSQTERSSIEGHLKDCPKCQFIYGQERSLKREIRMVAASVRAPAGLREKILSDRRIFPESAEPREGWKGFAWPMILRPAFVLTLLLILVLPALYLLRPSREPISLAALKTHEGIEGGTISFVRTSSPQEVKKQLLRSVGGRFAPMGYDLSSLNLRAVGGVVQESQGRKILVSIYEGKGPAITCFTFLGTEGDAPDNAAVVFDPEKRINFYSFSSNGVNGVFHREGKVICILVSKMPMLDLLALARSKARPS